jgi:hypothetical protein
MKKAIGIAVAIGVAVSVLVSQPASAATPSVSSTPASWTPYITSSDTVVRQLAQCGNTMYAVGSFTSVGSPGHSSQSRGRGMAFDAGNGTLLAWDPQVNGIVDSIAFTPDCASAFLGGSFSSVRGTGRSNLVKVSTATAAVDPTFNPAPDREVYSLMYTHGVLIAGGSFSTIAGISRSAMASLNPTTGQATSYLKLNIQGNLPNSVRKIYNMEISHSGNRLLAMGSFTSVLGVARRQIFMLDLGSTTATLDNWYAPAFSQSCSSGEPFWLQAAAWSPDDSRIYVATTGYRGVSPLCDTAAAYSSASSSTLSPLWINRTGCDSLYSVAADDTFVYVGGHERWMSNPACDSKGAGALDRPGVGSMTAASGAATSWNPTRARGKGADDMIITSAGLWIASDNWNNSVKCGGVYHPGICFFPY